MSALLSVRNISKSYRSGTGFNRGKPKNVLSRISFDLEKAQILAVVGESGSGKSTLARQLLMLEQPDSGEILLRGKPLHSEKRAHEKIRIIFQNPVAALNSHKRVHTQLEESLLNYTDFSRAERSERIQDCMQRVGLDADQAMRYPHMFSGGQRQRIAIARALMVNPEIIVADEAVSALDVSVQAQIINLILDLKQESGMSWVFITHDLSVVRVIADKVLVMYAGRIMESGSVKDIMEQPLHPYTQKLLQSVPRIGRSIEKDVGVNAATDDAAAPAVPFMGGGCVYLSRCSIAGPCCRKSEPPLIEIDGRLVSCCNI